MAATKGAARKPAAPRGGAGGKPAAGRANVRQHTRRQADGSLTTVRQHARRTMKGRKPLVSPRHAWALFRRAVKSGKRGRKAAAITFGALALGELGAWGALRGVGLVLATAGVLAVFVGALAMLATGSK